MKMEDRNEIMVNEEKNEVVVHTANDNIQPKDLYNMLNAESTPVSEIVGTVLTIDAIAFEPITYADPDDPEKEIAATRTVLHDADSGMIYSSVSKTLRRAFVKMLSVYGGVLPVDGVNITIKKNSNKGKTYYNVTLN